MWSDYTDKVTYKKALDYWAIVLGNIFLPFRKMTPLLVYKEFPLCHTMGKTKKNALSQLKYIYLYFSFRLDLAFIQAKLLV